MLAARTCCSTRVKRGHSAWRVGMRVDGEMDMSIWAWDHEGWRWDEGCRGREVASAPSWHILSSSRGKKQLT